MFTMGRGVTTSYSRKIKLNSRSSTKTELLTLDMYMPEMLWSLYFIQLQGYEPECVGLYQDNISTQLLIKNGNFSSGKKTKHIKAKFFFIKDKLDSGEIRVIDCPAEEMWADVLTKPLQGMAFRTMREQLMNCAINYKDKEEKTQSKLMHVHSRRLVTWKTPSLSLYKHCRSVLGLTGKSTCQDRLQTGGSELPESRTEQEEQRTKSTVSSKVEK
jgi:hypothetical protein